MKIETAQSFQTFDDLLRWRAQVHPERPLYTYLENGEQESGTITYAGMDRRARVLAAELQKQMQPGDRALLLYPPGIDYVIGFFGCLYAGVIAVPAYPPDPTRLNRTLPRLQAIAADARASLVLTTTPILQMAQFMFAQAPDLAALRWLAHDGLPDTLAEAWRLVPRTAETIAFLQYTSGSTRTPKGVMLSHGNLLHNAKRTAEMMELTEESRMASWLPPYHDMGLIGMLLQPAYRGFHSTLMAPIDFLKRPLSWLRAMSKYQITITGGPNFAYDLCVRKFDPAKEPTPLDLSHLRVLFNGAEPIRPDTLQSFSDTFAPYGFRREAFYPCYGLAEGTLIVSGVRVSDPPATLDVDKAALMQGKIVLNVGGAAPQETGGKTTRLAGSGRSLVDQTIAIVDPESKTLSLPGQVGEIWARGDSIAQGYWDRPEETAESFAAYTTSGEGPFLRTGDLGFLHEGELYVTGRRKDMIIMHGQNHYPQDIELTVERSHPALRPGCGAAFAIDVAGEERLVVVQEVNPIDPATTEAVMQGIRQAVSEAHEIPVYGVALIAPKTMFKTSSGKIQRFACRHAYLEGTLPLVSQSVLEIPATREPETEAGSDAPSAPPVSLLQDLLQSVSPEQQPKMLLTYLRHQVAELLGLMNTRLDPTQPLSTYGITSVQAVELSERLETGIGRKLPATLVYDYPTLTAICDYLLQIMVEPVAQNATHAETLPTNQLLTEIADMSEQEAELALLQELGELGA